MELHNLKPAEGSVKREKRVGRGQGAGTGGTSTRGHKGAKSRSGYKTKKGFEGGQMPIQRRLPKRGFKNPNRVEYVAINVGRLQSIHDKHNLSEISPETLISAGIITKNDRFKVLGSGELNATITVKAHAASKTAQEIIESKGGSITLV